MARIRSIHPGLLTDEAFMALTVEAPLAIALLIGILTECDDEGVFEWKPLTLKARILPAVSIEVAPLLDALVRNRFIKDYEIDGRRLGAVRNFCRFQRPQKPTVTYPKPGEIQEWVGLVPSIGQARSQIDPEPVREHSGTPFGIAPQMEGEKEKEKERPSRARPGVEFDRIEAACREALDDHAPTDRAVGPMVLLVQDGIDLDRMIAILRSEARRPRRKPIRTWRIWADIVRERLAEAGSPPPSKPPDPVPSSEDRIDFGGGYSAPAESILMAQRQKFWPSDWGPPPRQRGCRVPERLWLQPEVAA